MEKGTAQTTVVQSKVPSPFVRFPYKIKQFRDRHAGILQEVDKNLDSCTNFEIHITLGNDFRPDSAILKHFNTWKYSCIDGDPLLGKGKKHYLTTHRKTRPNAVAAITTMVDILEEYSYKILRVKIEAIVYDTKKI